MSVRRDDAFQRAVSRRDLLQGPAIGCHLLSAASVLLATATLLNVAALLETWLGHVSGFEPSVIRRTIVLLSGSGTESEFLPRSVSLLLVGTLLWILHRFTAHLAETSAHSVARGIGDRIRSALFRQHQRIGPGDVDGRSTASVYQRTTADVSRIIEATADTLLRHGRDTLAAALCLVLALLVDPILALQCLLLPAALLAWLVVRDRAARQRHLQAQSEETELADDQIGESLSHVRLACGYGAEGQAGDQFASAQAHGNRLAAVRLRRHALGQTIRQGLTAITASVILFLVSRRVLLDPTSASLDLPSAMVLLASIAGLLRALDRRGELPLIAERAGVAAARIYEYLDLVPPVSQAVGARFLQPLADEIRFEAVTWQPTDNAPAMKGLDLEIPAGETTALLSVDPREARGVAWLLARFIDPHGGRVLIDGQDIATGTLESLRAEVLVVAGEGGCFRGSVLENICCGRPEGGLNRAIEAAKAVHAHHFISKLPQGYETLLGEGGVELDAGQAYRIGLARALARDPALLVIEEPGTALDADTKSLLGDTYDRLISGRTVILLPTRLSTVRRADRVVLVHDGQVAETGRHEDLVRNSDLYRHWEYTRFNAFKAVPVASSHS